MNKPYFIINTFCLWCSVTSTESRQGCWHSSVKDFDWKCSIRKDILKDKMTRMRYGSVIKSTLYPFRKLGFNFPEPTW